MTDPELYCALDVEADGRIPGRNSMLSFAVAAFTLDRRLVDLFERNLETLPGAEMDPETKAFSDKNQKAWEACRRDLVNPGTAMAELSAWLFRLKKEHGRPVLLSLPGAFDHLWLYWYYQYFNQHHRPIGFSTLCMKSYGMALLGCDYAQSKKRNFPRRWFAELPHTHVAADDAIETGAMAIAMIRESRKLPPMSFVDARPGAGHRSRAAAALKAAQGDGS